MITRPIEHGADLVMHSGTKYLNGHSDVVAGVLVTARADDYWRRIVGVRKGIGAVLGVLSAPDQLWTRTALLVGRLMRDVIQLFVQALILVGLGIWLGMRASVGGVVIGIALTLLIGGACAAASNALALTTKSEDVMAPVINMVMMPVLLLSGILLPMTLGPAWLERTSDFMPFRWIVDAVRGGFAGTVADSTMLWGVVWALGLFALAVWWGTAVFRKENA